jgi:hypothetical protein
LNEPDRLRQLAKDPDVSCRLSHRFRFSVAFAFPVVIPAGDLPLQLLAVILNAVKDPEEAHQQQSCGSFNQQALVFAFLVVIPAGDLRSQTLSEVERGTMPGRKRVR